MYPSPLYSIAIANFVGEGGLKNRTQQTAYIEDIFFFWGGGLIKKETSLILLKKMIKKNYKKITILQLWIDIYWSVVMLRWIYYRLLLKELYFPA